MCGYGEYSLNNSILAIYKNGKLKKTFTSVISETVFFHQDYHNDGKHLLEFKYRSGEIISTMSYYIKPDNSFCIFPEWMENKLVIGEA